MTDRTLTIIAAVLVTLVIGYLVLNRAGAPAETGSVEAIETAPQEETRETRVSVWLTDCSKVSTSKFVATGRVRNTGNTDLHYVTVKVLWINAAGLAVEENELYALNNEQLKPGEEREFTDVSEHPRARQCNVDAVDWW